MKKSKAALFAIAFTILLSSCGVNGALVYNQNQNSTQVHLRSSNYKVIERIQGSADVSYVLVFGGLKKRQLFANAYAEMIKSAAITSGPRAIVNVVAEEHIGGVPPFYQKRTVTVSGHVIEFTN